MSRYACIILFILLSHAASASDIYIFEDKTRILSASDVYSRIKSGRPALFRDSFNPGFTKSVFWLVINASPENFKHKLIIGNAHINRIDFYTAGPNGPKLKYITGDHFPFKNRPENHPLYIFPLDASEGSVYLLKVDKHNESLQLTAEILTQEELYHKSANNNLINGLLWGIIVLILIFGCFLYITVKERLYLYYVLYILALSLWVIADKGYGYQFLWPDFPDFASRARPALNAISIIMIIRFMQSFIGQNRESPFYIPLNIIQLIALFLAAGFLTFPRNLQYLGFWFLGILIFLGLCTIVLVILSSIEKIRKGNKQAWFYLISISTLIVFSAIELLVHVGGSGDRVNYLATFGIQTGLITEAIILNFGLAHRFNSYKNEKEKLLLAVNQKQNELTARIIQTQEAERKKIADQLHDEVGSMLSLAALQISSALDRGNNNKSVLQLQKAGEVIGSVSDTIRNMSHTLTPPAIEKYGFKNAITDLLITINLAQKIQVEYVIIGFEDTSHYSTNLLNDSYRIIKELMNNILKHSDASHCFLQLIEHEDGISIMVEDNGKGMQSLSKELNNGMGLDNIHSRIDYFQGRIEVSEKSEGGMMINIEIPVKAN